MFDTLPKDTSEFIIITMLKPGETESTKGTFALEGAASEVVNIEALFLVPMMPRLLRLKPTLVHENPKPKKGNQKRLVLLHESPRKSLSYRCIEEG